MDGSIEPYQNTTEGAEIFFRCNPGFVPAGRMRAVCGADGRWNPDTATVCTCEYHINLLYSKTSNNGPSEKRTTSLQRTAYLPPIDFTIELIHFEPPRSGHLSTPNNGH